MLDVCVREKLRIYWGMKVSDDSAGPYPFDPSNLKLIDRERVRYSTHANPVVHVVLLHAHTLTLCSIVAASSINSTQLNINILVDQKSKHTHVYGLKQLSQQLIPISTLLFPLAPPVTILIQLWKNLL